MPETPILFYSPGTCAASEIVSFEWAQLPYRLCRVGREDRQGEAYRAAINPNGQVPALRLPGGEILTENAALLAWIADQVPERRLAPAPGTPERYRFYLWLSWLASTFHVAHYPVFAPGRYVPDPALAGAVREHATGPIRQALARLEGHLRGRAHMMGDARTVLDPYVFAMARWSEERLDYASHCPAVKAFLDRMREDPAVRFLDGVEKGEIVEPADGPFRGHVPLAELLP